MRKRANGHALDKAVSFGLLSDVVEVQVNRVNGAKRLKDGTDVMLAQGEGQRADVEPVPGDGRVGARVRAWVSASRKTVTKR